jgi:hypothetical protein
MENPCLNRVLFCLDDRAWTWQHALACAEHCGLLAEELARLRSSQGAVDEAMTHGRCLPEQALPDAITEWRFAFNLISAQETEQWLAARDLDLADLGEHLNRQLWRAEFPDCESAHRLAVPELAHALWVQACLNDSLARLLRPLAQRVLCHSLRPAHGGELPAIRATQFAAEFADELAPLEAAYQACLAEFASSEACERALAMLRPELLRLRFQVASFAHHDAAAEARLCVRDDGESLATVAERVSASSEEGVAFACDLDVSTATRLLSAAVGECTLPNDRHRIYVVLGKIEPDLADPSVAERVRQHCLASNLRPHLGKLEWPTIHIDLDA